MVNISRILKFLTWHGFDEFGWNHPKIKKRWIKTYDWKKRRIKREERKEKGKRINNKNMKIYINKWTNND